MSKSVKTNLPSYPSGLTFSKARYLCQWHQHIHCAMIFPRRGIWPRLKLTVLNNGSCLTSQPSIMQSVYGAGKEINQQWPQILHLQWWAPQLTITGDIVSDLGACMLSHVDDARLVTGISSAVTPTQALRHIKKEKWRVKSHCKTDSVHIVHLLYLDSVLAHPSLHHPLSPLSALPASSWHGLTIYCRSNGAGDTRSMCQG